MQPIPAPVSDPTRRRPRVGGFRGPAATCADPGKGIATQRLLPPQLKIRTEIIKISNRRSQLRASDPNAELATKNPNRGFVVYLFSSRLQQLDEDLLKWNCTTRPMAAECVPLKVHEETTNPEAFITKLQRARSTFLFDKTSNWFKMNRIALPSQENMNSF